MEGTKWVVIEDCIKCKYICRMFLIDTHTHLYAEEFNSDRKLMIENAIKNEELKMTCPIYQAGHF